MQEEKKVLAKITNLCFGTAECVVSHKPKKCLVFKECMETSVKRDWNSILFGRDA